MPIELKIPEVSESITEVQIAQWLKAEGDQVQKDEAVAVIDSEKTTFELPAPESGTLGKILHQAGDTVAVGEVIAQLEAGGADAEAAPTTAKRPAKPAAKSAAKADQRPKVSAEKVPVATPAKGGENENTAEAAERTTSESRPHPPVRPGKSRATNQPDGKPEEEASEPADGASESRPRKPGAPEQPDGKSEDKNEDEGEAANGTDTPAAATQSPAKDGEEEIVPMSMLRRTVARRLVEAKQQMAMLTTFNEVDMSAVQALRHEHQATFEKRHQVKLGLMSFFVKAAVDALKQFPQLNAEVRGNDIVYRNHFNIGVAIATGRGLVVPVLRRAERLGFADVEKSIADFAQRAKDGKLKPDELDGATFTLTNGGVFGSLLSTPIINPPQSGILGMHTIQERPIAVQGQVVIRPMMYLALTYDHRIVDGREAVLFLCRIKEAIESPARMLLEV